MSFQFHIEQVWTFEGQAAAHAIGVLEIGKILPPVTARVAELEVEVQIESVAIGGGRPVTGNDKELTLVIQCKNIPPKSLEGKRLVSAQTV